ncbi:MAG: hypothetical protein K0S25_2003 [Bacillus sp. (in: firmicutes)]|nr:hypothetical protein [Bacillales bacterium]MDF2904365.1 hypothetical protein [Bacillus sp. (in: firmicutes)]
MRKLGIKYGKDGEFDSFEEQVNDILNTNALIILLNKKGLISKEEFSQAKDDALKAFKEQYPSLFKN